MEHYYSDMVRLNVDGDPVFARIEIQKTIATDTADYKLDKNGVEAKLEAVDSLLGYDFNETLSFFRFC